MICLFDLSDLNQSDAGELRLVFTFSFFILVSSHFDDLFLDEHEAIQSSQILLQQANMCNTCI